MKTRFLFTLVLLLAFVSLSTAAQEPDHSAQGYVFYAPSVFTAGGGSASFSHFGAGGEGFLNKGFAIGAELGAATPNRNWDIAGLFSGDAAYHFRKQDSKFVPFVAGGYSLLFQSSVQHGFNVGAGFSWWANDHHGIRLEARNHTFPESGVTGNLFGIRVAWSFR
jgi:hypothetical protein